MCLWVWDVCADSVFDNLIIASKGWRNIVQFRLFYYYFWVGGLLFANSVAQLTVSVKSSRFVTANFSHGRLRVRDTCEWSDDAIQIQIPGCSVSQTMTTTVSRARRQRQKACSDNLTHTRIERHMHRHGGTHTDTHTDTHSRWKPAKLRTQAQRAFSFCFVLPFAEEAARVALVLVLLCIACSSLSLALSRYRLSVCMCASFADVARAGKGRGSGSGSDRGKDMGRGSGQRAAVAHSATTQTRRWAHCSLVVKHFVALQLSLSRSPSATVLPLASGSVCLASRSLPLPLSHCCGIFSCLLAFFFFSRRLLAFFDST